MNKTELHVFRLVVVSIGEVHRNSGSNDIGVCITSGPRIPTDTGDLGRLHFPDLLPNPGQMIVTAILHKEEILPHPKRVYRIILFVVIPVLVRSCVLVAIKIDGVVWHRVRIANTDHIGESTVVNTQLHPSCVLAPQRRDCSVANGRFCILLNHAHLRFHVRGGDNHRVRVAQKGVTVVTRLCGVKTEHLRMDDVGTRV